MTTSPHEILHSIFGFDSFRGPQEAIVNTVVAGGDALVLMPTGGGKSLCYQIPALARPGTAIVISPLIALMQDQVAALVQSGVRAAYLSSTLEWHETQAIESQLLDGRLDLLYIAPERLVTARMLDNLARVKIALFAIDEAHCVSHWGHDFRSDYLGLSILKEQFPNVPRIALTATADPRTRADIIKRLGLERAEIFLSSFDRPNIFYRIAQKQKSLDQLEAFIRREHPGDAGIIYCLSRNKVEKTAEALNQRGIRALPYHAGLPGHVREENQTRFLREEGLVMVATIAFGMGIDKPNVRFVAHLDLPKSIESYYQETGRAGRDGLAANAWMVYGIADVIKLKSMLDQSEAGPEFRREEKRKVDAMLALCETVQCRRQLLLAHFGEELAQPCGHCDNCIDPVPTWDATEPARLALSAVYRTGSRYGVEYLVEVLRGERSERILTNGHDSLSVFGRGTDLADKDWRSVFRQLLARGLLQPDPEGFGALALDESCRPLLRGETTLMLRREQTKTVTPRKTGGKPVLDIPAEDRVLWEALRARRRQLAQEQGVPPYVIFHDSTLMAILAARPRSLHEMGRLAGVGEAKLERYGEAFLDVVNEYA
ncbi:MAG: ATP-dependent helicase RecQ [Moraxellaceae bacterium]|jgi:ATP-dependent DNA helicase RecQ|nr:ATP-dependent helicase RecQ [Moraxellaceae bacterium]